MMSKIDDLIAKYCPNGVEYKEIGNIWVKQEKSKYGVAKIQELESGDNICFTSGNKTFFVKDCLVDGECLFMNDGGVADIKYHSGKAFYTDHVFAFGIQPEIGILTKYVYYCLKNKQDYINEFLFKGAGLKNLNKKDFAKFQIPVPPLAVQEEIINILDSFTLLEAELEAELEARKKQYEHYRDKLLNFADISLRVRTMALGDIGKVTMCKRIMKNQTNQDCGVPFYKIGTFGKKADSYISREVYNEYKSKYPFPKKGDILLSASGTIGRTVIYDGMDAYFQDSNIVWLSNDETKVLNKYLFYVYQTIKWPVEGGTIKRLYNDNFKKIEITVPSLAEQERIISILDKFDALVNDISDGLPAEINARRQQYEYYRDKLLNFEPMAA